MVRLEPPGLRHLAAEPGALAFGVAPGGPAGFLHGLLQADQAPQVFQRFLVAYGSEGFQVRGPAGPKQSLDLGRQPPFEHQAGAPFQTGLHFRRRPVEDDGQSLERPFS